MTSIFMCRESFLFLFGGNMIGEYFIITNNPLVMEKLADGHNVIYLDVSYEEVLLEVRNRIHQGAQLLSHPLSGSVKPGETPYKSVLVSKSGGRTDMESLEIIEKAIETCRKFPIRWKGFKEEVLEDFKLIDFTLISSAVSSADA